MRNKDINTQSGKVLIVYYSYSGNTRKIAKEIQKVTNGDMVEIQPRAPYPSDYQQLLKQAGQELRSGSSPELKESIEGVAFYDTLFVGSPNWYQTIAPPLVTFLSQTDLSGKKLIPFVTHGGGGLGRSAIDIGRLCPQSTLLESMVVRDADFIGAQKWLSANWLV